VGCSDRGGERDIGAELDECAPQDELVPLVADEVAGGSGEPVGLVEVFEVGSVGEEFGGGFVSDTAYAGDIVRFIPGQGAVVAPLIGAAPRVCRTPRRGVCGGGQRVAGCSGPRRGARGAGRSPCRST
jgi:hypothetical protein